ncbi:electron transfer flavoprotein subunit alpha/FixB family protein [Archaeoglobus veneficus]|uniref:Electron transfer flavoprotein alpha subunit n=1 Tax=Archaeoglobus veneficus (strain DSM 11195 / SNP6) TaxID=693661 RepID=F2KPN8_ARCVS|nr:electron transfer flavoprotein subunit alpha/FixB family protein [Archaeoglobus veneficus]AEA47566.1 Electron transfer flavoprotein alpha subunit [Archaeoglobus veneficus SNP6]
MDVLVFAEVIENEVQDITYELVGKAKQLASELGGKAVTLVIGNPDVSNINSDVIQVDAGDPSPWHYAIVEKVYERVKPAAILFGNTSASLDVASQFAAQLGLPIATLVTEISVSDGQFVATSIAYGGKIMVDLAVKSPGVFVVNRGSFQAEDGKGEVGSVEKLSLDELGVSDGVEFVGYIKPEVEDVDISKADIVVSVGRGIGDEANIELAEELAEVLGGVVAGSRPIIDSGWLPKTRQVGRSGKTVVGKLYLALGISGATEHVEGVKAKNVIAINTDRDAPIFRIARCGAVADVLELVPVLIDKIREIKGE